MCVDVEPEMGTAAAVACAKPPPKYNCLCWRYFCSIEGVAGACIAAAPGVTAARAATVAAAVAGVAAARGDVLQEAIRLSRWWSRIV